MPAFQDTTRNFFRQGSTAAGLVDDTCRFLAALSLTEGNDSAATYYFLVGAGMHLFSRLSNRIAEDPPRMDYESMTTVRNFRVKVESLAPENSVQDSALRAAVDADEADAYLSASLRAFERYQGAIAAERDDLALERAREATRYMQEAGPRVKNVSANVRQLAAYLRPRLSVEGEERSDYRLEFRTPESLPEATLARLYLGGLPIEELRRYLRRRPRSFTPTAAVERLASASEPLFRLGDHCATWTPPELFAG